ncbi:MAG: 2-isopropylmalate synthase [Sulfuricellaceae bacterium]|nr:2-isopropylmalate synthase [Sulfuricellaceae bacterium]
MLKHPETRYTPFPPVALADRSWPSQTLSNPPIWMSTDLRDGNQALFEPMNAAQKMRMFKMLVEIGFKEIEVAFPSASQTDFDFVRELIEGGHIPGDVNIEVLTQAREHLIRRTMESLRGTKQAIVHLYTATSPTFRRAVFRLDRAELIEATVASARLIKQLAGEQPDTRWTFQYSPETFTATELDFAREICDAVIEVWQPTPGAKAIINLPATVEVATPHVYADQIEWMHRHLARRDSIVLSVHPHNDRGCAVAAAELAQMAGAERVEGCLFGNGERTGNVDLVTLALNLYTQGVDPGLDFSRINEVARTVEDCTRLPIHPRHPYVGDLVFTAFSGSHQDAIKKGLALQAADAPWDVPYLPIDPADLGRAYDSIIRVNSQSGKGGIAYLLEAEYGLVMPRRLQVEFSAAVQRVADATAREIVAEEIWRLFGAEYLSTREPIEYIEHHLHEAGDFQGLTLNAKLFGAPASLRGIGNGPIAALLHALGAGFKMQSYEERSTGSGADAVAVAYAEIAVDGLPGSVFGVGMHANIVTASVLAVIGGINRACGRLPREDAQRLFPHGDFAPAENV